MKTFLIRTTSDNKMHAVMSQYSITARTFLRDKKGYKLSDMEEVGKKKEKYLVTAYRD